MDYLELRDFYSLKVFPALNFFRMPHVIIRASTVSLISYAWCALKSLLYLCVLGPLHAIIPLSVVSLLANCAVLFHQTGGGHEKYSASSAFFQSCVFDFLSCNLKA